MYVVCICNAKRRLKSQREVVLHFVITRVSGAHHSSPVLTQTMFYLIMCAHYLLCSHFAFLIMRNTVLMFGSNFILADLT